jgi:uncharacterized damage-inducible protein DinB
MHCHFVRLATVCESDSEFARTHPDLAPNDADEWRDERDPEQIAQWLNHSAQAVHDAVKSWLEADISIRGTGKNGYDHPILLLGHLLWHEGYHVGQIKLALKISGCPLSDQQAGPVTWDVWRQQWRNP